MYAVKCCPMILCNWLVKWIKWSFDLPCNSLLKFFFHPGCCSLSGHFQCQTHGELWSTQWHWGVRSSHRMNRQVGYHSLWICMWVACITAQGQMCRVWFSNLNLACWSGWHERLVRGKEYINWLLSDEKLSCFVVGVSTLVKEIWLDTFLVVAMW